MVSIRMGDPLWRDENEEDGDEVEDVTTQPFHTSGTRTMRSLHPPSSDSFSDSDRGSKRPYREQYHGYAFSEDENVDSDIEIAATLSPRLIGGQYLRPHMRSSSMNAASSSTSNASIGNSSVHDQVARSRSEHGSAGTANSIVSISSVGSSSGRHHHHHHHQRHHDHMASKKSQKSKNVKNA